MRIMPVKRSLAVALISASTFVAVAGCSVARKTSTPMTAGASETPKKEYQWKDMSQGNAIFRQTKPTPEN